MHPVGQACAGLRARGYWRTNTNGTFTVVLEPVAGNCQFRTWFSMHFVITGSSPVALALSTWPFGPTVIATVTFALDF